MGKMIYSILRERAAISPASIAYEWLEGEISTIITYQRLDAEVRNLSVQIRDQVRDGQPVLLAYPPGLDFIKAFWACLYAGIIAVPTPLPIRHGARLAGLILQSGATSVLTNSLLKSQVMRALKSTSDCQVINTSECSVENADAWCEPDTLATDLAYLQYTSGSTSAPHGVMISHKNILANLSDIDEAFAHHEEDRTVSWLPHFHDMGLVYGILQPVFNGVTGHLLAPSTFIRNPLRWLQLISRARATHSGGPNFAYELCIRRISLDQCQNLDLSTWRVAFSGAEPIRRDTLKRFFDKFSPFGFREDSFYPAYGLAEATLKVTSRDRRSPVSFPVTSLPQNELLCPPSQQGVISCGKPGSHTAIRIVDHQQLKECPAGQVGEIWVAGDGVAQGYWNDPEATVAAFRAFLDHEGPFLRTGDLGFINNEELYVTGRLKELIIVRGENYYPHDIESTAESVHPSILPTCVSAFAVSTDDSEELVIVAEVQNGSGHDLRGAVFAIRAAVSEQHGVVPCDVVLVRQGTVPKTTSGKVQRLRCRDLYLSNKLAVLDKLSTPKENQSTRAVPEGDILGQLHLVPEDAKSTLVRCYITDLATALTGRVILEKDLDVSLIALGLDSLRAAEMEAEILSSLRVSISAAVLLDGISLAHLISRVVGLLDSKLESSNLVHTKSHVAKDQTSSAVSTEQERLYWLHEQSPNRATYNIGAAIRLNGAVYPDRIQRAASSIMQRHQILQSRFEVHAGKIAQVPLDGQTSPILSFDLSGSENTAQMVSSIIRDQMDAPFDLGRGPCIRILLIRTASDDYTLALVLHHIVADFWSVCLLFREIVANYMAHETGQPVPVPTPALQFTNHVTWETSYLRTQAAEEDISYWVQCLSDGPGHFRAGRQQSPQSWGSSSIHRVTLPTDITTDLRAFNRRQRVTLFMTLLASIAVVLAEEINADRIVIGVPMIGRQGAEETDIVGPFAHPLPMRVDIEGCSTFSELLEAVRISSLQAYERRHAPLSYVAQKLKGKTASFRFLLTLLPNDFEGAKTEDLNISAVSFVPNAMDLDLYIAIKEMEDQIDISFFSNPAWRDKGAVGSFAEDMVSRIKLWIADPQSRLPRGGDSTMQDDPNLSIVIAATFTAGPIADAISFWLSELNISSRVSLAPYNQVFQQLLDRSSDLHSNKRGVNLLLIRLEDWIGSAADLLRLREDVNRFIDGVRDVLSRTEGPLIVVLTPPSPTITMNSAAAQCIANLTQVILDEAKSDSKLQVLTPQKLLAEYLGSHADSEGDKLGHIPYTDEFMTLVGMAAVREIYGLQAQCYKVIVLDCDDTLWRGACAEVGPTGVEITAPYEFLQEFMLRKQQAGILLCLCSRNNACDVEEVFRLHPRMLLKDTDFVARRIGWQNKSAEIRALSHELGLDLSSFIFLDDNPVECAEVRAECPEVLTLQLPSIPENIPTFLKNIWAFDQQNATTEDHRRSAFYAQEARRSEAREHAPSLQQFLNELELEVSIRTIEAGLEDRISQLASRTNQFNLNGRRYSKAEIATLSKKNEWTCLVVNAKDRFGDYGLVGAAICESDEDEFWLRGLWLSCRALGRGIESRIVREIGSKAKLLGFSFVHLDYVDTGRNSAIRMFLEQMCGDSGISVSQFGLLQIPIAILESSTYLGGVQRGPLADEPLKPQRRRSNAWQVIERIAYDSIKLGKISNAADSDRWNNVTDLHAQNYSEVEASICSICADVLGIHSVGLQDDFFAMGGDSLQAVQVLARINRRFSIELPMDVFFETDFRLDGLAEAVKSSLTNPVSTGSQFTVSN